MPVHQEDKFPRYVSSAWHGVHMAQYQEHMLMLVSQLVWYRKYVLAAAPCLLVTVQQSAQQQVLLYLQTVLLSVLRWKRVQVHQ